MNLRIEKRKHPDTIITFNVVIFTLKHTHTHTPVNTHENFGTFLVKTRLNDFPGFAVLAFGKPFYTQIQLLFSLYYNLTIAAIYMVQ